MFDATEASEVRVGSPFAIDPPLVSGPLAEIGEAFYDIGPTRYMAWGAVFASAIVLIFAGMSSFWFPAGGLLVSALGGLLGIAGMFSPRPIISAVLLGGHLGLFLLSAYRWVM